MGPSVTQGPVSSPPTHVNRLVVKFKIQTKNLSTRDKVLIPTRFSNLTKINSSKIEMELSQGILSVHFILPREILKTYLSQLVNTILNANFRIILDDGNAVSSNNIISAAHNIKSFRLQNDNTISQPTQPRQPTPPRQTTT